MDYQQLQHKLDLDNANLVASETHGCMWGLYCGESDRKHFNWKNSLAPLLDEENQSISVDLVNYLETMSQEINQQLEEGLFEAPLLLPSDEEPLASRIEGLANWCGGWLLGFGLSSQNESKLSEEGQEALTDVRDISQVDFEVESDLSASELEEMEKDFLQLCEHIKIAIQIIQSDIVFNAISKSSIQNSKSLH